MVKINLSVLVFCPTIFLATLKLYKKFEAEKSVTENLIGEKDNWTNKGNGKHQEADSLSYNATSNNLYQI